MTDLRSRFATLDAIQAPDLWSDIQARAAASSAVTPSRPVPLSVVDIPRRRSGRAWVMLAAAALLAVALVIGALAVGSRLNQEPDVSPPPSAITSSTPEPSSLTIPTPEPTPEVTPAAAGPGGFVPGGSLAEPRLSHVAILLDQGRVLIAGGETSPVEFRPGPGSQYLDSVELWDPSSQTFRATAPLAHSTLALDRVGMSAFRLSDGRVLVVPAGCACRPLEARPAELWDPRTESAQSLQHLQIQRNAFTATQLADGRVLIAGGNPSLVDPSTGTAEIWDAEVDGLAPSSPMAFPRAGAAATLLRDGRILIVGGMENATRNLPGPPPELWDPTTATFSVDPGLNSARVPDTEIYVQMVARTLRDGRVLILDDARARVWDPATDTLAEAGTFAEPRTDYTATVVGDGRVLVIGGISTDVDPQVTSLRTTELWDPATGRFTAGPTLAEPRAWHTATLLPDGRVLVIGGSRKGHFDPATTAEIWDPAGAP